MENNNKDQTTKTIRFENDLLEKIGQMAKDSERDFSSQVRLYHNTPIRSTGQPKNGLRSR